LGARRRLPQTRGRAAVPAWYPASSPARPRPRRRRLGAERRARMCRPARRRSAPCRRMTGAGVCLPRAMREPLSCCRGFVRGACVPPVKLRQHNTLPAPVCSLEKKKEQKLKFSGQSLRILSGSSYLSANEADRRCYAIHKENDAHPVENHEKLDLAAKSHPGSGTLCKTCSMCLIKWATQSELQCSTAEIVHSSASQRSLR